MMDDKKEKEIYDKIYRMAFLFLGNYHDAWDLTQEVIYILEKGREKWQLAENKWAWACGVFHRQRKKFFRTKKSWKAISLVEKIDKNTPDKQAMVQEQLQNTFDAIDKLSLDQKEALLMFSVDKMSLKEIAGLQNTSVGTVKWRIFEARRKISRMVLKI